MTGFRRTAATEQRVELWRGPEAAGEARRFVDRVLRSGGASGEARDSARLVASELVTNALQHGDGQIELRLKLLGDFLRIEVIDEGRDQAPAVRQDEPDESGGWGLRIVDHLAAQWGVFEGTTHVWADLALG